MRVTRKKFLQVAATACGIVSAGGIAIFDHICSIPRQKKSSFVKRAFCPFCSIHCDLNLYLRKDKIVGVEALDNSFASNGKICAKAHLIPSMFDSKRLRRRAVFRKKGASLFSNISIDDSIIKAAELIKSSRDSAFMLEAGGMTINACDSIAVVAGEQLSSEEAYAINKFSRICSIEKVTTAAILKNDAVSKAYTSTFGIAALQNPHYDFVNSDLILIIGANPVRTNPMFLEHLCQAKSRGASVIVIDPIVSETARIADIHIPVNPGSDLLLFSSIINYLIRNKQIDYEYIRNNSDAPFLVNEDFAVDESGHFSGYNESNGLYDSLSWSYIIDERGNPKTDFNLKKKNSVFRILEKIYARYTPDVALTATGGASDHFLKLAESIGATSHDDKSCAILFGGGFASTSGEQGVRSLSIIQLLCGNIGVAGGGVHGLHGRANEQGVADQIGGWNLLPGYLPLPNSEKMESDYNSYIKNNSQKSNDVNVRHLWSGFESYFTDLMRLWYPTMEPKQAFELLPKCTNNLTSDLFLESIEDKTVQGLILFDINLFAQAFSNQQVKHALDNLQWIIVFESEISLFSRYVGSLKLSSACSVLIIPLESFLEKDALFTSSDRRFNSKDSISFNDSPVQSLPSLLGGILSQLKQRYSRDSGAFDAPFRSYSWAHKTLLEVRNEISGAYNDDKTQPVGNWLYRGLLDTNSLIHRDYQSDTLLRKSSGLWPQNAQLLFNKAGLEYISGKPRHLKSVVPGDELVNGDVLIKQRPFYFNRDGVAYIFSRLMTSGPLPLPFFEKNNKLQENQYQLIFSDYSESNFADEYPVYKEIFAEQCLIMHNETLFTEGFISGEKVVLSSGEINVTLPLYASSRIKNLKSVLVSGKMGCELLKISQKKHFHGQSMVMGTIARGV